MSFNSSKRNRGFILTQTGWNKLQARMHQIEQEKGGRFTQQALIKQIQLIDAQGLHPITLRKIMGQQIGVDERSLRVVLQAVGLELEACDYKLAVFKEDEPEPSQAAIETSPSITETELDRLTVAPSSIAPSAFVFPDFPGGPVPLDSPFYIEQTLQLTSAYREISRPGGLVRVKAPQKSGKSSFTLRLLRHTESLGYRTLKIDFQQLEESLFSSLDRFLRWFCAALSYQLDLEAPVQEYWNDAVGSKVSCTIYLQKALLKPLQSPVVLVLNEVNRLFEHPAICQEFLPLLRSWYEEAKYHPILQKLHFVLSYSTEIYVPLNLNQSPFNIGLPIQLTDLTLEEIQRLANFYGLSETVALPLKKLVGGRPYLIQLGLYHLYNHQLSIEELLQKAVSPTGIYASHLRGCLSNLQQDPDLIEAFQQILATDGQVDLSSEIAYKLESLGVVKLDIDRVKPSCRLYQQFFADVLGKSPLAESRRQLSRPFSTFYSSPA